MASGDDCRRRRDLSRSGLKASGSRRTTRRPATVGRWAGRARRRRCTRATRRVRLRPACWQTFACHAFDRGCTSTARPRRRRPPCGWRRRTAGLNHPFPAPTGIGAPSGRIDAAFEQRHLVGEGVMGGDHDPSALAPTPQRCRVTRYPGSGEPAGSHVEQAYPPRPVHADEEVAGEQVGHGALRSPAVDDGDRFERRHAQAHGADVGHEIDVLAVG